MATKVCKRCGKRKKTSDFYNRDTSCKKCRIACVKEYRRRNAEKVREYDKSRGMLPHRVEARAAYQKTEAGKAAKRRANEKQMRLHPIKRGARVMVGNAVRDGRLRKPKRCEGCKKERRLHGHHDDYARPLDVRWLCTTCHRAWHAEHGEGLNG